MSKANALYNILQDNNQPHLSASDKDLRPNFFKLFDLAFLIPHEFEGKFSNLPPVNTEAQIEIFKERKEDVLEKYLDRVFDVKAKLPRAVWEKFTCSERGNFIFSGKSLRKVIDSVLYGSMRY